MPYTMQLCPICGAAFDIGAEICDQVVCQECAENRGYKQCEACSQWFEKSDLASCRGTLFCADCAHNLEWYECEGCNEFHRRDDMRCGYGDLYCEDCWNDRYFICSGCGETYHSEDAVNCRDELYCRDCAHEASSFEPSGFRGSDVYINMPSKRKFGVELEAAACECYGELDGSEAWGAKDDCTVTGKEFYSDILSGDAGLEAIEDLCDFASEECWEVDGCCGYHAHFGMREETTDSMKAIALAYLLTYEIWCPFVRCSRVGAYYCSASTSSIAEIRDITDWSAYTAYLRRYCWINFHAYYLHRTFEIRLHHGTLDKLEICNWIRAHATFMDWASKAGWDKVKSSLLYSNDTEKFELLAKVWQDAGCIDLEEYYDKKANNRLR